MLARLEPTPATDDAPLTLYRGIVRHARLKPVAHRFAYAMSAVLIDLDRLPEAAACSLLFSVNRANLIAFYERDHGPRDGSPLRPWADALLAQAGCERPHRIRLLCYPTVLGYVFNPLSVYFCEDSAGRTSAILYQVHNTFGQSHCYVEPLDEPVSGDRPIEHCRAKQFYVSPFMEMDLEYRFRIEPPADAVSLRIRETGADGPVFFASFEGRRVPPTTAWLLKSVLQTMGITWKVTAAIHWEALRLWRKGLKLQPRPAAPAPHSFPTGRANGERPQATVSRLRRVGA
jgi:DUF1365 family protein